MCNDRELACFKRLKTCVLALPNLPLSSPDTHPEDQKISLKHHYIYEFYYLLTKTGLFMNYTELEI